MYTCMYVHVHVHNYIVQHDVHVHLTRNAPQPANLQPGFTKKTQKNNKKDFKEITNV